MWNTKLASCVFVQFLPKPNAEIIQDDLRIIPDLQFLASEAVEVPDVKMEFISSLYFSGFPYSEMK